MLSSNQIAGNFDSKYLLKKYIDIFNILHGDIHQGKIASETASFGWFYPGILIHVQTFPDLIWVVLVDLGVGQIKNCSEWQVNGFLRKQVFFPQYNTQNFKFLTKMCSHSIRLQDSLIISISRSKQSMS